MSKKVDSKEELEAAFKGAYASLNAAQKDAVDTIDGPVMVIAGPGTGKTQILTLRIANILLKTDTAPDSILALTFTESGSKAMRERLRRYIGARAYQVPIYTFHGFAEKLIRDYPDAFERVIGGRPASDLEKIKIIESILESSEIKLLRPMGSPTYYVTHILREFSDLKKENISPDSLAEIINKQEIDLKAIERIHTKGAHKGKVRGEYTKKEKSIGKNKELLFIYRLYEASLREKKLYDFEDMIVETVKALSKNRDMLLDLQETYQYVLADEHQDVNGSQNKILELLCSYHESPNIFVVGDEKQAIYRFQGASLENFLYFEDIFKKTKTISLIDNYRSGQVILDAAHSLVEVEEGPLKELRVPLQAKGLKTAKVENRQFSHQAVEDNWLVESILSDLKSGVKPEEIAVIIRTNKEVEAISALLRKNNIAVSASADADILTHPMTQAVERLIKAVVSDKDESALFAVLHGTYWGISTNDLFRIASARNYENSLLKILSDEKKLSEIGVEDIESVSNLIKVIETARDKEVHEAPHRVLEYLLQESGLLDHLIQHDPFEGTRVVRRLYDEIEVLVRKDGIGSLKEICDMFDTRLSYGLALNAPYVVTDPQSVQVMTAHKSKGLEFEVVYVSHLNDSLWGGSIKRTYFDVPLTKRVKEEEFEVIDDERRLFYVAMTRAKRKLSLSCSDTNSEGKELLPTRLFDDIDSKCLDVYDTKEEDKKFSPVKELKLSSKSINIDLDLLRNVLSERGFSATSLNNYLRSPWDYFYRNVLRIPEVQPTHMQFGTAVHNVLEKVTKYHTKTGKILNDNEIKRQLESELNRLPVNKEEYVRLLEKGLGALYTYTTHIIKNLPKTTKEELNLRVILPTGLAELPELPLTGKLDRLDIGEDGRAFRVVDYKTGKSRSRNAIEGKTASVDGGYKRQLVFYTLLLSIYDDDRYRCKESMLSFVEPDSKGVIHEETFTITKEEVEELKQEIIKAAEEIINGRFLSLTCDESVSDYCHLVKLL